MSAGRDRPLSWSRVVVWGLLVPVWPVWLGWRLGGAAAAGRWVWRRWGLPGAVPLLLAAVQILLAAVWWLLVARGWGWWSSVGWWVGLLPGAVLAAWVRARLRVPRQVRQDRGRPEWLRRVRQAQREAARADARSRVSRLPASAWGVQVVYDGAPRTVSPWVGGKGRWPVLAAPDIGRQGQRMIVVGGSGSGKSTALQSLLLGLVQRGAQVMFFNCKGDDQDTQSVLAVGRAAGLDPREVRRWPVQPFDIWRGSGEEVAAKVLSQWHPVEGAAAFYRDQERTALRLVCMAGDGPPGSSAELLKRLARPQMFVGSREDLRRLRAPVTRGGPPLHQAVHDRVADAMLGIDRLLDGGFTLDDPDWRLAVFQVAGPDHQRAAAAILQELDMYRRMRRRPDAPPLVVVLDEAQTLLAHPNAPEQLLVSLEQYRALRISVVVATQSVHGLGDDAERLLGSGATIMHGCGLDVDQIARLGGTRTGTEAGHRPDTDESSVQRTAHMFNIDPDWLRTARPGEFVVLEPGHLPCWVLIAPPRLSPDDGLASRVRRARHSLVDGPAPG